MKQFLFLLMFAVPALAQQNMGAVNTPQVNSTFYVGSVPGFNSTIQATVTAACAAGGNRVIDIPAGYAGSDPISGVTAGCTSAYIKDERSIPDACYTWSGTAYASAGCSSVSGGPFISSSATSTQTMAGPLNSPGVTSSITDSGGQAYNVLSAGAQCNGSTDDSTDIQSALTSHGASARIVLPAGKTCVVAGVLSIPGSATLDLNYGTLKFTGSGGGACSAGTNGLIQMFGFSSTVQGPGYINTVSSTANCLFNISNSSFATGNTVELVQSTTATSTHQIGAYVANQASVLIDNNEWSQFYPASATIGIIDIPGTVNVGTISANNFQLTGETIGVYPSISVTGQTTSLTIGGEKQGNLCELGYCVYVNEPAGGGGIDVNSIKIDHNYVENGGTSGPDINLAGGVSGAEVGYNYMVNGAVGVQIGSSGGGGANPLATRVIGNIITSQPNAIIDYGSASVIESNTVNGAVTTGLTENGSASIFGNIFTSSPVVLNTTGSYVGVNTYYAGSLSCPNGGNVIFDTGISPNANCNGTVASPSGISIKGNAVLAPVSSPITSATGASGTGAVTCLTATCTNLRGTYSVAGGTFGTGTFLTLTWPATPTAYVCTATQGAGGIGDLEVGNSVATPTGMSLTNNSSMTGVTIIVNYSCQP